MCPSLALPLLCLLSLAACAQVDIRDDAVNGRVNATEGDTLVYKGCRPSNNYSSCRISKDGRTVYRGTGPSTWILRSNGNVRKRNVKVSDSGMYMVVQLGTQTVFNVCLTVFPARATTQTPSPEPTEEPVPAGSTLGSTTEAPVEEITTEEPTEEPTYATTEGPITEEPTEATAPEAITEESTDATTQAPTTEAATAYASTPASTSEANTQAPTTEAPTAYASTQASTSEATTQATTQAPTSEANTQAPITEEKTQAATTQEIITVATAREVTTEEITREVTTEETDAGAASPEAPCASPDTREPPRAETPGAPASVLTWSLMAACVFFGAAVLLFGALVVVRFSKTPPGSAPELYIRQRAEPIYGVLNFLRAGVRGARSVESLGSRQSGDYYEVGSYPMDIMTAYGRADDCLPPPKPPLPRLGRTAPSSGLGTSETCSESGCGSSWDGRGHSTRGPRSSPPPQQRFNTFGSSCPSERGAPDSPSLYHTVLFPSVSRGSYREARGSFRSGV